MKKRNFLWALLPSVLLLSGCGIFTTNVQTLEIKSVEKISSDGITDTFKITYSDGTVKTFTMPATGENPTFDTTNATLTRDALKEIQGRLDLDGVLTTFAGDETAKGVDTTIDVTFTEDAWYYSAKDDLGQENTGNIFKIGGKPVIAGINLQNELVFSPMTDDEGALQEWSDYENPFTDLTVYDFVKDDNAEGVFYLRLDLPHVLEKAIDIVTRISNYQFPDLTSFGVKLTEGKISEITFETPDFASYFGTERYVGSFKVSAKDKEVPDLTYPEVNPTLPEHEKLTSALKELNESSLKATYVEVDKEDSTQEWEDAFLSYDCDCYFTDEAFFINDKAYGQGYGAVLVEGVAYELSYDPESDVYTRFYYPLNDSENNPLTTLDEFRPNYQVAASEMFTVIDDKHFEMTGVFAGTVAYNFDLVGNYFSLSLTKVSIELNDEYKVKEIVFTDDMFTKTTMTFEQIGGTIEMPFTEEDLVVEEDPFLKLVHTYKYNDEGGTPHEIVVKSLEEITFDGAPVENISFDKDSEVIFEYEGTTFEISFYSRGEYYCLTIIDSENNYQWIYSNDEENPLVVE